MGEFFKNVIFRKNPVRQLNFLSASSACIIIIYSHLGLRAYALTLGFYIPGRWPGGSKWVKLKVEMILGIGFVISACFLWGLIFVVPQFMVGYSPLEIALARYFFYGLLSAIFLLGWRRDLFRQLSWTVLRKALWFGLIANILYYPCLVLSIKYATPVIATLIFGLSPIAIALYGNWKQKECSFSSLIVPILGIATGLVLVNWPALRESSLDGSLGDYCLGIFFGLVSVGLWTYYAVSNARFLKTVGEMSSLNWSSIVGVATLAWVLLFMGASVLYEGPTAFAWKYLTLHPEMQSFMLGGLALGFFSTWLGMYLWNLGSSRLPVSFAGQLTVFETIFGLSFVFIVDQQLPSFIEMIGASLMISGVIFSINAFNYRSAESNVRSGVSS